MTKTALMMIAVVLLACSAAPVDPDQDSMVPVDSAEPDSAVIPADTRGDDGLEPDSAHDAATPVQDDGPADTMPCTHTCWYDRDRDTYGAGRLILDCRDECPLERNGGVLVSRGGDCNDDDPAIRPGALDPCDGLDWNCDGNPDREPGSRPDGRDISSIWCAEYGRQRSVGGAVDPSFVHAPRCMYHGITVGNYQPVPRDAGWICMACRESDPPNGFPRCNCWTASGVMACP
jgi:hypothetical protein